jgi:hypothetical protein
MGPIYCSIATGFPVIALVGEYRDDGMPGPVVYRSTWTSIPLPQQAVLRWLDSLQDAPPWLYNALSSSPHPGCRRFLPVIPVLPGFLINTVFWGLISWGAHRVVLRPFGAVVARRSRARRRKRGLCIMRKCGYQVGALEVCPECGAPQAEPTSPKRAFA